MSVMALIGAFSPCVPRPRVETPIHPSPSVTRHRVDPKGFGSSLGPHDQGVWLHPGRLDDRPCHARGPVLVSMTVKEPSDETDQNSWTKELTMTSETETPRYSLRHAVEAARYYPPESHTGPDGRGGIEDLAVHEATAADGAARRAGDALVRGRPRRRTVELRVRAGSSSGHPAGCRAARSCRQVGAGPMMAPPVAAVTPAIEQVPIDELRPDPANPRRIDEDELEALTRSIARVRLRPAHPRPPRGRYRHRRPPAPRRGPPTGDDDGPGHPARPPRRAGPAPRSRPQPHQRRLGRAAPRAPVRRSRGDRVDLSLSGFGEDELKRPAPLPRGSREA